ncbi:MAG: GNAT family N-acetyltransferase [Acidimicrobiales bacterium]
MARPRQLRGSDLEELQTVLELVRREFAYMDGLIDPPSSVHRLTIEDLASGPGEVWAIGTPPHACVVLTPKPGVLYVGKLAVSAAERGRGLANLLMAQAERRARELELPWLELQTRIELTGNQQTFIAMGFVETERTAHPGFDRPTSITYRRPVMIESDGFAE